MKSLFELIPSYHPKVSEYINARDEMIKQAVVHINELRKGTAYEKSIETPSKLALRINRNVFFGKHENNGELLMVINECKKKGNYSNLYWLTK